MSDNSNKVSFEQLGSNIDAFFSKVETRINDAIPQAYAVKSAIVNAPVRMKSGIDVDLWETENAFKIVCDLPGATKENVQVKLLSPTSIVIKETLEEANGEEINEKVTYHFKERKNELRERTIVLPAAVASDGAKATFSNGVMEITLMKKESGAATDISIE